MEQRRLLGTSVPSVIHAGAVGDTILLLMKRRRPPHSSQGIHHKWNSFSQWNKPKFEKLSNLTLDKSSCGARPGKAQLAHLKEYNNTTRWNNGYINATAVYSELLPTKWHNREEIKNVTEFILIIISCFQSHQPTIFLTFNGF